MSRSNLVVQRMKTVTEANIALDSICALDEQAPVSLIAIGRGGKCANACGPAKCSALVPASPEHWIAVDGKKRRRFETR